MLNRLLSVISVLPFFLTGSFAPAQKTANSPVPLKVEYSKNLKCYYGVIGHVEKQGVFEFKAPCANLAELIERTGGLKNSAIGNLKIVHSDGTETRAFYSTHSKQKMLPNDILVIEGIAKKSSSDKQLVQSEKRIRIGLINLVDRPVIMKIRPELATLERLLDYLNQPRELAKSLRIVQPSGFPSQQSENATSLLTEGSIIVFETDRPNARELPILAEFEPAGMTRDSSFSVHTQNGTATTTTKKEMSEAMVAREGVKNNGLQPASRTDDNSRLSSLPPNWAIGTSAGNQASNESNTEAAANKMESEGVSKDFSMSSMTKTSLDKTEPVDVNSVMRNASPAWKQRVSTPMFVTVICILSSVLLISGYLLWSISPKASMVEQSHPIKTRTRNHLKELLEDSIPIMTLDVQHPGNFKLFDTASREKVLRIDAAHQVRRPQFLPRDSQPEKDSKPEKSSIAESVSVPVQYDTVMPPDAGLEDAMTALPETEEIPESVGEDSHKLNAPHFLKKRQIPKAFQPHMQQNDYIQRVLQRVRKEEQK